MIMFHCSFAGLHEYRRYVLSYSLLFFYCTMLYITTTVLRIAVSYFKDCFLYFSNLFIVFDKIHFGIFLCEPFLSFSFSTVAFATNKQTNKQCFGGSHTAKEGAKRYIDVLLPCENNNRTDDDDDDDDRNTNTRTKEPASSPPPSPLVPKSGSFFASRKGFIKDYGNVADHKNGKFCTDIELQEKAWDAVNQFLS